MHTRITDTFHPQKLGNKYLLLDKIGSGGMAEVYRGKLTGEKGFEKLIVIKKLLPHIATDQAMVAHFTNEARLAAMLQHENITAIYDYGEIDGEFFIVMEYLFGKDLSSVINRLQKLESPFPPELALIILAKICDGMEYAHNLKDFQDNPFHLIHRDLTPQNIFLTYEGKVKILDFGIAKSTTIDNKTRAGVIKGKMNYMSPEQIMGNPIDHRSDIFSMGILLYEMLSGIKFYSGDTGEVIRKSVQVDYTPLPEVTDDLPLGIYSIVEKAIERDPDDRYQNSGEMGQDIKECLRGLHTELDNSALQDFILAIFSEEYEAEKENAKKVLTGKPQYAKPVQFDKTIFLDTEFTVSADQTESLSYAPKNPAKDTLQTMQQPTPEPEITPDEEPILLEPAEPEQEPEQETEVAPPKKVPPQISPAREKETKPKPGKKIGRSIAITGAKPFSSSKKLQNISIKASDRRVRTRTKTGLDVSSILRSFGPFFIVAIIVIAGGYFGYQLLKNKQPTDYFAGIASPEVPLPTDNTILTSSQKQVLLLGLTMKAEAALKENRLLEPPENSAFVLISQAMQLDANDKTTQKNFAKLVSLIAHQADVALQEGRKSDAARFLVAGLALVPDHPKLMRLKEEMVQ